jgi:nicotinamide-nucleotide amidase
MATAEIIAIGTELLLGVTQDTNTHYLANALRSMGIDLYRTTVIGDNEKRITEMVNEALNRADIVITTGGLGPTIDDPTRNAIANAFSVSLQFHQDLWDEICERFKHYGRIATENNKRQAYIPANAIVIRNPVGTAPSFYIHHQNKLLVSLPGVPKEMEHLFTNEVRPLITKLFPEHALILTKTLHLIGIGESYVDQWIGEFEKLSNPTVGLCAHASQIDIRITAKAAKEDEARLKIDPVYTHIYTQLKDYIYGEDEETIEMVISSLADKQNESIFIHLINHQNSILENLSQKIQCIEAVEGINDEQQAFEYLQSNSSNQNAQHLAFAVFDKTDKMELLIVDSLNKQNNPIVRSFLGPRGDFPQWLSNNELGYLFSILKA